MGVRKIIGCRLHGHRHRQRVRLLIERRERRRDRREPGLPRDSRGPGRKKARRRHRCRSGHPVKPEDAAGRRGKLSAGRPGPATEGSTPEGPTPGPGPLQARAVEARRALEVRRLEHRAAAVRRLRDALGSAKLANFANFCKFFSGLVLGCIKTKFCKKICVCQHFSSSTRFAYFCTAAISKF